MAMTTPSTHTNAVHPTSMVGGRRKRLILLNKFPFVHPSTINDEMNIHAGARVRRRLHAHAHAHILTHTPWTGWTGGRIEVWRGFAPSTLTSTPNLIRPYLESKV